MRVHGIADLNGRCTACGKRRCVWWRDYGPSWALRQAVGFWLSLLGIFGLAALAGAIVVRFLDVPWLSGAVAGLVGGIIGAAAFVDDE